MKAHTFKSRLYLQSGESGSAPQPLKSGWSQVVRQQPKQPSAVPVSSAKKLQLEGNQASGRSEQAQKAEPRRIESADPSSSQAPRLVGSRGLVNNGAARTGRNAAVSTAAERAYSEEERGAASSQQSDPGKESQEGSKDGPTTSSKREEPSMTEVSSPYSIRSSLDRTRAFSCSVLAKERSD